MERRRFACLHFFLTCVVLSLFLINSTSPVFAQTDVTNSIELVKGRLLANRATLMAYLDVGLKNIGSEPIQGPILAVIDSVSTDQVTVENADGTTDEGKPYYIYNGELGDGILDVQETSSTKQWTFHNPNNLRFYYNVIILVGLGDETPPIMTFTNPPQSSVISNNTPLITIEFSDEGSGIDIGKFSAEIDGQGATGSFTVSETGAVCRIVAPLAEGTHQLLAAISDLDGNITTITVDFEVRASFQPLRYLFSVKDNDWIFASPGDGTYVDYYRRDELGISIFSDLVGISQVFPEGGDLYFTLKNQSGILQSPLDGSNTVYRSNTQLGLSATDQLASLHIGIDGKSVFSLQGVADLLQSEGANTHAFYMQNVQLGLSDSDPVNCLHIGYDNTVYLCNPDGSAVLKSIGDGTNSTFLTDTDLGVPNTELSAFAILPETTPPQLTITNPADGAFVNTTLPNFTVAFSDSESGIATDSFHAELDGTDVTDLFAVTTTGANYQVAQGNELSVDSHTLDVSIQDRVGNQSDATSNFSVGVLRAIPGATPVSGPAPLTVHFTTDGEDPAGTIQRFRWDFDGNGSYDTYDEMAQDYNRTYNTPGSYNATLYIWSSTGASTSASITITVQNNPPVATADILPSNGEVPLTAQLIGSGSDSDGSIVLYEWDLDGDGTFDWSSSTTGNTTYTYTVVGSYQAVFRVTDNDGQTATALAATTVVNTGPPGSPTATASANPIIGNAPLNVAFNGTATDPNNDIVLYEWDFDCDGTYDWSSATSGVTSYTYTQAGTHVAKFRVTDSTGLTGVDQIPITVNIQTGLSIQSDTVGFIGNGMTATASSQYSSSYPPSNALNNSNTSRWFSRNGDSAGAWFEVSFNQAQIISNLYIYWYSTYSYKMTRGRIDVYDQFGDILYSQEHDFPSSPSNIALPDINDAIRIRCTAIATTSQTYIGIGQFVVTSIPMPNTEPIPTGTNINTSISADSQVSILIKNENGDVVRTLVNNQLRSLGNHSDYWDCRDDSGAAVNDGVYYAVMQYVVDGQVRTYDLTNSTGGGRYNPPRLNTGGSTSSPMVFKPFEDEFLPVNFTLSKASEVTLFVGILYTTDTRIKTVINRQALPAGNHTIYWDGTDDNGNIAEPPPGNYFVLGIWGYYLPNNAMFMTGGKPVITNVSADPNYYSPFSEKCDNLGNGEGIVLTYNISENADNVQLRVYSMETGSLLRTAIQNNISAGENSFFWDGKNNNGEYADIGDYQIGLVATDRHGNASMLKYALVRIDY
ncbi:MAG: PKD domain-containing protein [Desulfobacterales bacterium]|nr:PKD domain-containing protein [Desulfobacterales bacterium]